MLGKEDGSDVKQRVRFWCWVKRTVLLLTKSTVLVLGKEDGSLAKQRVRFWCWVLRTVLVLGKEYGSGAG